MASFSSRKRQRDAMASSSSKRRRRESAGSATSKKRKRESTKTKSVELAENDPSPPSPPPSSTEPNPSTNEEPSSSPESIPSTNKEEEEAPPPSSPDRISSLPDEILTTIISLLPLRVAVMTSILSSRWRHLWTIAPISIHIYVYAGAQNKHFSDISSNKERLQSRIDVVTDVFSRHHGPIRSFFLSRNLWTHLMYTFQLDQTLKSWTKALAKMRIESLTLCYKLPRRLVACQSLRSLDLVDCDHLDEICSLPPSLKVLKLGPDALYSPALHLTKLPPALSGCESIQFLELRFFAWKKTHEMALPPNLRKLTLWKCKLKKSTFSNILSGCSFLDTLSLGHCNYHGGGMLVSSPSLRRLAIDGLDLEINEMNLVIGDAPNLEVLVLKNDPLVKTNLKVLSAPKLRACGYINAAAKVLKFGDISFKNGTCTKSSTCVHSLKRLAIKVNLGDISEAKMIADLLKCFPYLKILDIMIVSDGPLNSLDHEFWEKETSFDCLKNHMRIVNVKGFPKRPNNLGLVRFLLRNAQPLKVMSFLCYFKVDKDWEDATKRKLMLDKRESLSDLEVTFEQNRRHHPKFSIWRTAKYKVSKSRL